MHRSLAAVLPALAAAPGLAFAAPPRALGAPPSRDVRSFVEGYVQAQNRADVPALLEMYSRRPDVSSATLGEIVRGWEALRGETDRLLGREGSYRISLGAIDAVPLGNAHVLVVAPFALAVDLQPGAVRLSSALTLALERRGGRWTILHEHISSRTHEDDPPGGA